MKFTAYLKDRIIEIVTLAVACLIFSAVLLAFKIDTPIIICFWVLFGFMGITLLLYSFLRKRAFYAQTRKILLDLDKKYLLSEMVEEPNFWEGKFLCEVLWQTNKSMREHVGKSEKRMVDFRDYIELWVHEIKTPLSALSLSTKKYQPYVDEMENYIEQALFYSKISATEKDYIIKHTNLEKIINEVIRNNKTALIGSNTKIELTNLDQQVYSDTKWLRFIINQIILNSIKYHKENPTIQISAEKKADTVTLSIIDNGIGIKKSELKRVFEKGFTGTNGRQGERRLRSSTGMGLYISSKLAEDLGHKLTIESEDQHYTKVSIIFPESDFYKTLQNR